MCKRRSIIPLIKQVLLYCDISENKIGGVGSTHESCEKHIMSFVREGLGKRPNGGTQPRWSTILSEEHKPCGLAFSHSGHGLVDVCRQRENET